MLHYVSIWGRGDMLLAAAVVHIHTHTQRRSSGGWIFFLSFFFCFTQYEEALLFLLRVKLWQDVILKSHENIAPLPRPSPSPCSWGPCTEVFLSLWGKQYGANVSVLVLRETQSFLLHMWSSAHFFSEHVPTSGIVLRHTPVSRITNIYVSLHADLHGIS